MGKTGEIKYDFESIKDSIAVFEILRDRAITCSSIKFTMNNSKGDGKKALLEAHKSMVDVSISVAIMIGNTINDLKLAINDMSEADQSLANNYATRIRGVK